MKKKVFIIFMICCFFILSSRVKAGSSFSCTKSVNVGNNIECKVLIDEEPVMVKTENSIKIIDLNGESYSKLNEKEAIFYKSGTIIYGPASSKDLSYTISLYSEDGTSKHISDCKVKVLPKTTTTTTTTTTRKKSSNNYLSEITIDGEKLEDFSKNKNKYYVTVHNNVKKILVDAKTEDEYAKIDINEPKSLEIGDNEYTIGVTSEDDTTKFYKIIVTREDVGKSSDTKLKSIKVKDYKLNFDNKAKTFYLKIKEKESRLNISVVTNDKKAEYEITDNENLKDGSVIKIKVTAEDLSYDTYRIIIQKDKKSIMPIIISVSLITIVIIVIIFIIIFKSKKKKNGNKKNEDIDTKKIETLEKEKIPFDNDLEEKTTVFTYDEEDQEDTKTTILDTLYDKEISDDITKTVIFDDINKEWELFIPILYFFNII